MAKKKQDFSTDELCEHALVPEHEWPYKVKNNWTWIRLGKLVTIKTGKEDANFATTNGKYLFYTCAEQPLLCDLPNFSGESILIAGNGMFHVNYFIGNFNAYQRTYVLQNFKGVSGKYLYYHLKNSIEEITKSNRGSTIQYIRLGDLTNNPVPLPPLAEQQRIVDRIESLFEKLDQAKGLIQDALDSFENRKAAILHKAFSGELTKNWRDENGIDMDSWEEKVISDVCIINPKKIDTKELPNDLIVSFIPMPAVSDILGIINEPQTRSLGEVKKGYTNFIENDVIFAKITPCMENGKAAIVGELINGIGFGSTEFHVFRCSERINNKYLYHLLRNQSFRDEAKAVMTGAVGQQRVPKSFLENYLLILPKIEEQMEIVKLLDDIFEKEQNAKDLYELIGNIDLMKKATLEIGRAHV